MFRLRYIIHMMTNAVIVGSLIILVLSLGWVGWAPMIGAIVLGFVLAYPVSIIVTRWIKVKDPAWNEDRDRPVRAELRRRERRAEAGVTRP
jgi:hypothetical protein